MPPGYRFLVAPLQQSPSPRVTSCLCWLLPHPAACSFSTPFPSCQHFLAAEVAAGPGGQQGSSETFWGGGAPQAPEAPGNSGSRSKRERPGSPRDVWSLTLLQQLPGCCFIPCPQALILQQALAVQPRVLLPKVGGHRVPVPHPSAEPGRWHAVSHVPAPGSGSARMLTRAEPGLQKPQLLRRCSPRLSLGPAEKTNPRLHPALLYKTAA